MRGSLRASLKLILATALGFSTVSAQTSPKPGGHDLAGRDLQVELVTAVKAKKAKVGDAVSALTVTPITLAKGIVLRAGSKVTGHVRQVEADSGEAHTSFIAISFEEVLVKKGETVPLNCFVRAAMMPALKGVAAQGTELGQTTASTPGAGRDGMNVTPSGRNMGMSTGPASVGPLLQSQDAANPAAAHSGQVVGMRGVELQMNAPEHLSTFRSAHKNLELDEGLQLMLVVQQ